MHTLSQTDPDDSAVPRAARHRRGRVGQPRLQLAALAAGVVPSTPRLAAVNFKGAFNVNGNRVFNNVFLLDGVDNLSYSSSYRGENVQVVQPSIEALQEFRIQTNASSAEFGRGAGAIVGCPRDRALGRRRLRMAQLTTALLAAPGPSRG